MKKLAILFMTVAFAGVMTLSAQPGPPPNAGPPAGVTPGPPANVPAGPPATVPAGPPANVPVGPPANVPPVTPPGPPSETPSDQEAEPAPATVNIIHGIPDFPATVCVNGEPQLPMFGFKDVATVQLPADTYEVAVMEGFGAACDGSAALGPFTLDLEEGVNYSAVAHLTADGEPEASIFVNDSSAPRPGTARVVVHHAAAAPAVIAKIGRPTESALDVVTPAFENVTEQGSETPLALQLRPGNWEVELYAEDGDPNIPVFGPVPYTLSPHTLYLVYAVGALDDQFDFVVVTAPLPRR